MKSLLPFATVVCFLVAPLSQAEEKSGPIAAARNPSAEGAESEPTDVRTVLEKGRMSGALPDGMVIRVGACLGAPEVKASKILVPDETKEMWEFIGTRVRRIVSDEIEDARVEVRPFDSKGLCNDLLEGKAIEIQARKGEGPESAFIGTRYHLGWRSIQVVWKGETILNLFESRASGLQLYRESDARAFGALYERLASQARVLFSESLKAK